MINNEITIVTCFFDIGRGNLPSKKNGVLMPDYMSRSNDIYLSYFNNLAKIQNNLIVYTTNEFVEQILEARKKYNLEKKTTIIIKDSYLMETDGKLKDSIDSIMKSSSFISNVKDPANLEYWNSDYVLINFFKSFYVVDAIDRGYIETDLVAWIDFGYFRDDEEYLDCTWYYPFEKTKINVFNMRDIDFNIKIEDVVFSGDVYIQGCHIVSGIKMWKKFKQMMIESMNILINKNLIDDDQTLMLMSYIRNKDDFILRYNSEYDWFRIFKDYRVEV